MVAPYFLVYFCYNKKDTYICFKNVMNSPFVYGRLASDESFTDREEDTATLKRDFLNLTNTILISPRRWGKSSLVQKAGKEAMSEDRRLKVCHLDIFNARTEDEFYEKLASAIIKGTSSKVEEIFATAKRYASSLIPSVTVGDINGSISLEFKLKSLSKSADEILDMAQKIAQEKDIRIVVCIDEFQQIANYPNSDAFQAKLRSHWQHHQDVAYCLYGSRRHMMIEVFTNREKPFYKFGKTIFLEKIPSEKWSPFIVSKFKETGKEISEELCEEIVSLVDNNPYYIQQLSEEVWNRTTVTATREVVTEALDGIIRAQSGLNQALTGTLSLTQQNLLNAIVDDNKALTSFEVLQKYDLRNSLTVQRAKNALIKLDIIDNFGKAITIEDPIYAYWLKNIYFKK